VVSKETVRELQMRSISDSKLTDIAATVLAVTPAERSQVDAALERAQAEFKEWALSHTERSEPKDDVVAQYTLANYPARSVSNNFARALTDAVGRDRTDFILLSAQDWFFAIGMFDQPATMIVKRTGAGSEQRLQLVLRSFGTSHQTGDSHPIDLNRRPFPRAFLPVFPNGWADVAKREGFELPEDLQKK
jgi:hypothetical protein